MARTADVTTNDIIDFLTRNFGQDVQTAHLLRAADHFDVSYPTITKRLDSYKSGRGKWCLTAQEIEKTFNAPSATPAVPDRVTNLIPSKDDNFVPFGNFSDVKKIVKSGIFYPVFITGLSGNGKTFGVEQACAAAGVGAEGTTVKEEAQSWQRRAVFAPARRRSAHL